MSSEFFTEIQQPIPFGGLGSADPLTFQVYEPDRLVLGKRMADHLRIAVCYWHTFAWDGRDMFGAGTFDRPWHAGAMDPMDGARTKMDAAFEFFTKLGVPFYCFHDRDVAPEGDTFARVRGQPRRHGRRRRADTRSAPASSSCGAPPTCSATRATRPAPRPTPTPRSSPTPPRRCSAMLERHQRLGGANYVLWGGREGYDTLLNTDLKRERDQLGALPAPWWSSTSTRSASRAHS